MAKTYDVLLSFASVDSNSTFLSHLYVALADSGMTLFKKPGLTELQNSRCAVVIFSKGYASSCWCLDELVQIMECNKNSGLVVLPVFYHDFDSTSLRRNQGKVLGEFFAGYEFEEVSAWSAALVEAANLPGIHINNYRSEAECAEEIVEMLSCKIGLNKLPSHQHLAGFEYEKFRSLTSSDKHNDFIGMERRVQEVKALLKFETGISSKSVLASPSPPSSNLTYDVLISFRGDDACKDFAESLYFALDQRGIYTFRDSRGTSWNESVPPELMEAFEESYITLIIFSKNYAASSRCLDELLNIMNHNEGMWKIVYPVFYDVDPSDVRNQSGVFGEAFMQHKTEKVEVWRAALAQAGSMAGWNLNYFPKSDEQATIKSIVDTVSRSLLWPSCVDKNLIGIETRMKHVESLLKLGSSGVRMLGIWGMGGSGKTTIARAVFDKISRYFDGSCFAEGISEFSVKSGLNYFQKKILSDVLIDDNQEINNIHEGANRLRDRLCCRKVLIVLDDVDHKSQLESLAGSSSWFGEGSRIIITTRDEFVLVAHNVIEIYRVNLLNVDESIQFLKRHAFTEESLAEDYEDHLLQVVHYAAGLPLALKVLSSLLCGKSKKEWTTVLAGIEEFPEKKIQDNLKLSFDGLDNEAKDIFLDIACFFNGEDIDTLSLVLDSCGFDANRGIRLLEQKSLIQISKNRVYMHDLLRDLGKSIVRQTHPGAPEKRSRLWDSEDVVDILTERTGAEDIGAMVVNDFQNLEALDMSEAFKGFKNLKMLRILGHRKSKPLQGSIYLPDELRWLTWENYPLQCLPASFEAYKLSGLELHGSSISKLWKGVKFIPNLRYLDVSYSEYLTRTPDFTGTPKLDKLVLEHCSNLVNVHKSIGSLKRLSFLNLKSCKSLETLPQSILQLKSLKVLNLSGCSKLESLRTRWKLVKHVPYNHTIKAPFRIEYLEPIGYLDKVLELYVNSSSKFSMFPLSLASLKKLTFVHKDYPLKKLIILDDIPGLKSTRPQRLDGVESSFCEEESDEDHGKEQPSNYCSSPSIIRVDETSLD